MYFAAGVKVWIQYTNKAKAGVTMQGSIRGLSAPLSQILAVPRQPLPLRCVRWLTHLTSLTFIGLDYILADLEVHSESPHYT